MKLAHPHLDTTDWDALYTFVAWEDGREPVLFRYSFFIDAWNARDDIKRGLIPRHVTDVYKIF